MSESLVTRRKRLRYKAQHRGVLELDLIFDRFIAAHLDQLDGTQLTQFERLLSLDEPMLLQLMLGQADAESGNLSEIPKDLYEFAQWVRGA